MISQTHPNLTLKLLMTLILVICTLTVSLAESGDSPPDLRKKITFHVDNKTLKEALDKLAALTNTPVIYSSANGATYRLVTIHARNEPVSKILTDMLNPVALTYEVIDESVVIRPKDNPPASPEKSGEKHLPVKGKVTDKDGKSLPGATLKIKNGPVLATTDQNGEFEIEAISGGMVLQVSFIGYKAAEIVIGSQPYLNVMLEKDNASLQEVSIVSTGYQTLSKERATGSFDQIGNKLFNRNTSASILDRLNGIASGLRFNGFGSSTIATGPDDRSLGINIRGTSTLSGNVSTDPLIVVDNFPYEGNISNLNPNDVESVTILKDAAAASIWGARSGNGVIVITTKKGQIKQALSVEFNSNVTLQQKANLSYDRNYLKSSDYTDVETLLFKQGYFDSYLSDNIKMPPVSPVVNLLSRVKSGALSQADADRQIDQWRNLDVRNDYSRYIYRKPLKQQYALNFRGGSEQNAYSFSVGYDNNQDNLVRNGFDRITVNALNTYIPLKNLEITTGVNYSRNTTALNDRLYYGSGIAVGGPVDGVYPYAQFAGPDGNPLAVVKDYSPAYIRDAQNKGFLDWTYRPLAELALGNAQTRVEDLLLKASVRYKITSFLNTEVQYQHERQLVNTNNYQSAQTYAARNLVNRFTVIDPATGRKTYQVPAGGILNLGNYDLMTGNLRAQANYNQLISARHSVTAIAGAELRQVNGNGFTRTTLGYDDQFGTGVSAINYAAFLPVNPSGTAQIPAPDGSMTGTLNRYVSYFANVAYSYDDRYTLSLSGRKDGANIFGVKTNDKVTPLWSAGLSWNISREKFYSVSWLPQLKARLTYGYNGNVYNGSAYVTGTYTTNSLTGASTILNLTAPNPSLSWEKVRNINAAVDFSAFHNRVSGTVEWYEKDGRDLIDNISLAPSSGFSSFFGNSAATKTSGVDITLNTINVTGPFVWRSSLLLSTLKDKVTRYNAQLTSLSIQQYGGLAVPGKPLFGIYSYRWAGLDPANGDPQGLLKNKTSKDYAGIIANYNPDSLAFQGSARPTVYGAFRNDFSYHRFDLSVNLIYEFGFYFRRGTTNLNYADIISSSFGQNTDYAQRWQRPGDETHTTVPSLVYPSSQTRNTFYKYSEATVSKGDNIRLQDIRLSYDLSPLLAKRGFFKSLQVYSYAGNIGIVWRSNRFGIDPDIFNLQSHAVPNPFTIAFGFNTRF